MRTMQCKYRKIFVNLVSLSFTTFGRGVAWRWGTGKGKGSGVGDLVFGFGFGFGVAK